MESTPPGDRLVGSDHGHGGWVQVAYGSDSYEAQMIRGMLENSGIPSLLWPSGLDSGQAGFDGPERRYSASLQRVMVRVGRAEEARALLAEALAEGEE